MYEAIEDVDFDSSEYSWDKIAWDSGVEVLTGIVVSAGAATGAQIGVRIGDLIGGAIGTAVFPGVGSAVGRVTGIILGAGLGILGGVVLSRFFKETEETFKGWYE